MTTGFRLGGSPADAYSREFSHSVVRGRLFQKTVSPGIGAIPSFPWVMVTMLVLGVFGEALAGQQTSLRMDQVGVWPSPSDLSIKKVAVAHDGSIALLGLSDDGFYYVETAGGRTLLPWPQMSPIAVTWRGVHKLEILDAAGALFAMNGAGLASLSAHRVFLPPGVVSASATREGWLALSTAGHSSYVVHSLAVDAEPERRWTVHLPSDGPASIVVVEEDAWVYAEASPFHVAVLSPNDPEAVSLSNLSGTTVPGTTLGESSSEGWTALAPVPFRDGVIQTIADPTSDSRLMVLRDRSGRVVRETLLTVPMAFVGSSKEPPLLIAVRSLDIVELVGFTWRWGAPGEFEMNLRNRSQSWYEE